MDKKKDSDKEKIVQLLANGKTLEIQRAVHRDH